MSVSNIIPYSAPDWCRNHFTEIPNYRLSLGNLPTPLHRWKPISMHDDTSSIHRHESVKHIFNRLNITFLMKRDDMSGGCELGGNKVRKLEFLLADAIHGNYNAVVTIGGEQSNHCRATAAASRMVGLEPHLILRTRKQRSARAHEAVTNGDWFGSTGNILFDRIVGAYIYTCTPREYGEIGSNELIRRLIQYLISSHPSQDRKIYPIPVGGSNGLGTWGYIQAVDEILDQIKIGEMRKGFHVVFATGSGGTAAGITLGIILACHYKGLPIPTMHAIGVCDDPDYFYKHIADIAQDMGFVLPHSFLHEASHSLTETSSQSTTEQFIRSVLKVYQGKGLGYAISSKEELDFISTFAQDYGVALDPVYSGKAFHHFVTEVLCKDEQQFRDSAVLFWHTGNFE
jgi:D-cysteine desulfhydrase